ncbi:hypothetical protein B0H14DRAFT_3440423 [Mycena olivaceomarginata]|nr:hypothetical protein B0H14DRAFT_3440423 [Mycena olivaceomarginata]
MSLKMLLSDLVPDIIFSIFKFCDVLTVVSTGQTCRYLHQLAFDKSVWLNLMKNLQRRSILERTCTNLESLSTADMIGLAQRLLSGPETWGSRIDSTSEVSREVTLHTGPITLGDPGFHYSGQLLPSGRYVLVKLVDLDDGSRRLECWSVADNKLVWRHTWGMSHSVLKFAADETEDGDSIIIMLCVRGPPDTGWSYANSGTSESLFVSPVVRGSLAVAGIAGPDPPQHIIINWRERSHFILGDGAAYGSQLGLTHQHLILRSSFTLEDRIHIVTHDALRPHWAPLPETHDAHEYVRVSADDIPKLATFVDPDVNSPGPMYVYENPLQDNSFRLWVHDSDNWDWDSELLCYRLSVPVGAELQWSRSSVPSRVRSRTYHNIPYTSHLLEYSAEEAGYSAFPPTGYAPMRIAFCGEFPEVAPYSGALTYSTDSTIVIQYYK